MGKLSGLKKVVDGALDMSRKARMQRAKDMGFDVDIKYAHESPSDIPIQEISSGGRFGGVFTLPDDRAGYYPNIQEFYLKSPPLDNSDIYRIYDDQPSGVEGLIRREFGGDVDVEEYLDYAATFDNIPYHIFEDDRFSDIQKLRADIARIGGGEAVTQPDEFNNTVQLLGGSGIRDINAAFDTAKKESSNLLASMGGGAVLGGTALGSNETDAYSPISDFVRRRQAKKQHWTDVRDSIANLKPHAFIESPSSEAASTLADYSHKYNQYIDSRPLLQFAAPEAPEALLRKIAYDDRRGALDYIGAGIGLAP